MRTLQRPPLWSRLTLLAALLFAGMAQAATVTAPSAGDLFLGVRVSGGTGSGTSYIVNIGNDTTFRNATAGSVITLDNIGADLAATFGSDWHTRNDLFWGVFGTRNQTNPVTYASRAQSPFGSSAAAFPAQSLAARTSTNTQLISFIDAYSQLTATTNNAKAALQTNTATSASYNFQVATDGTSDFGGLSGWTSIEGNFGNGAKRSALDLFRFSGNTGTGVDSVARLGSFSITSGGALSFLAGPVINQVQVLNETVAVQEDAGSATITFERLGDGNTSAISATFAVSNGTAVSGTDYTTPGSLTVNFAANETTKTVSVPVINRTGFHGPRSFTVTLQSATGGFVIGSAATSTVTIGELDADPGALAFTAASFTATVIDTSVSITLERTSGSAGAVAVDVSVTGGTLVNGTGYTFSSPTTVNFADGATTASTSITLSTAASGTIILGLSNPTSFSRLGAQTTATVNVNGAPGTLAFSASSYSFPESAGTINIPIVRNLGLQGQVSVTVNTSNGSATAPSDFQALSSYTATLNDGQSSVNVPITFFDTNATETNESFTITISAPTGGASLGAITTATVRIEEYDTKAPTVALTAPVPNAKVTTASVAVTGSFTDDKGVSQVIVTLNGGSAVAATLTGNSSLTTGTFARTITAVAGPNTITVQSVDATGNVSPVLSRTFTYAVNSPLTVSIDPASPANSGTLTAPFPGTDNNREIGKSYTIVATPKTGFVFAGWSGTGISGVAAEQPSLTFTHSANLAITAKFIADPFVAGSVGEFNGLIKILSPATPNVSSEGLLNATVTTKGTFTGTVKIDGLSVSLTGSLNTNGDARFGATKTPTLSIARTLKPNLVLAFSVDLAPAGTHKLSGTVGEQFRSSVTPLASVTGDRASYSKTLPAPTAVQGTYTLVLPAQAQTNGLTSADFPQGDGIGSVTVGADGVASFSGKLADDSAFTAKVPLTNTTGSIYTAPVFAQLYGNKGQIATKVTFDAAQASSDLASSSVLWFKPYVAGEYYPFGWPEGVTTQLLGAKYAKPVGASAVPGLPAVNNISGNATLVFSDGKLGSTLSKNVNISTANLVTKVPVTNPTYTLTIAPATGDISGTFTHTNGTTPKFTGKIIQKGTNAGAYGYFLTVAPKVADGTGESGGVSLNHK